MNFSIPHFTIEQPIGKGGTSEVFRAISHKDNQTVAVKLLDKRYSEDRGMRKRLLREAQVISRLDHPNIVRIYGWGVEQERIYMVLQFLNRGSLDAYKEIEPRKLLKVMIQVCSGVAYIHGQDIVHRDLKPSNIMFGADGIPRLVDFGISLFNDDDFTRLTHTNMVMGTLSYMSPEQQSAPAKVDHRTDIYSLGAILYEVFTHQKPVGRFRRPAKIVQGFSQELDNIIMKAMAHQLEDRYSSAQALERALLKLWKGGLYQNKVTEIQPDFDDRIGYWVTKLETGTVSERMTAKTQIFNKAEKDDLPRLLNICDESGKEVRQALIPALGKLADARALPFLRDQIADPMLCQEACKALANLGHTDAVKPLALLVKKKEVFSHHALEPLARLSGDAHMKLILPYLKNPSFVVRNEALKALEKGAGKKQLKDIKKYHKAESEKELINRAYLLIKRLELG